MKRYTRKENMEFYVSECLAWPLKAELTMTKEGQKTTYKVGDFVLLYDVHDELQLAFMKNAEFLHLFETTGETDGGSGGAVGDVVRDKLSGGGIDPFRPSPKPKRIVSLGTGKSTGAYERLGEEPDRAFGSLVEGTGFGDGGEQESAYDLVGNTG